MASAVPPRPPPNPFNPRSNDARHPQPPVVTNPDGTERVFVRKAVGAARLHGQQPHRGREQSARLVGVEEPDPRRPVYKTHSSAMLDFSPSCFATQPSSLRSNSSVSANRVRRR